MSTQEEKNALAGRVVERMMRDDLFSQWLGIAVIEIKEGYAAIHAFNDIFFLG